MRHSIRYFASTAVLLLCTPLIAQSLADREARELLKKTDDATAYTDTDFAANYTLVQEKPGQGASSLTALMYRRDSKGAYTILITSPQKDKGKGYVQFDNNIWFYDPADKQFVFTSSNEKFQGSNATTADFTPQHYSRDYTIASAARVKLGKMACVVFDLKASSTAKDVAYPEIKVWVTEADALIRKREDYSLSGQLLRTTAMPSYQIYKNCAVPDKILFVDNLRGKQIEGKMQYEKTQITISNVSFAKQKDATYTKRFIEMMNNK